MNKILICGYYGFKNVGDEAILQSIVTDLRSIKPDIDISVLTYNAEYTRKAHNVNSISRSKIFDIIKTIINCDLMICGGGSLLQDITSSKSLVFYLGLIILAKLFKKKVMLYCNGYGPIKRKTNKLLIKGILSRVDLITLRDFESKKQLEKIGITKKIKVTADAAFTMKPVDKERVKEIFKKEAIPLDKKIIGISIRRWKNDDKVKQVISGMIDYFFQKGFNIVLLPMKYPDDLEFSMEVCEMCTKKPYVIKNFYIPQEVLGIIGEFSLLVGIRLHSLIFAAIQNVPMVGIEYDPKVGSFLEIVKQKNVGKIEELDLANLCLCIEEVFTNMDKYKNRLIEKKDELVNKVRLTAEMVVEMLNTDL